MAIIMDHIYSNDAPWMGMLWGSMMVGWPIDGGVDGGHLLSIICFFRGWPIDGVCVCGDGVFDGPMLQLQTLIYPPRSE